MLKPSGSKITVDQRAAFMSFVESADGEKLKNIVYPIVLDSAGERVRASAAMLKSDEVYTVSSFYRVFVLIGANVDL
jgi:hypothetical protein